MMVRLKQAHDFLEDEDGTSTVEFVMWVPIFVLILGLVVDICFIFLAQSRMYDVTADAARCWAIGACTQAEAEQKVARDGAFNGTAPASSSAISGGAVTLTASLDPSQVSVVGVFGWVASNNITASVTQIKEGF